MIEVEVAKERKAACEFFAYKDIGPLPPEVVLELSKAEAAGENATGTQQALITWMNRDARKIEMRKGYCPTV